MKKKKILNFLNKKKDIDFTKPFDFDYFKKELTQFIINNFNRVNQKYYIERLNKIDFNVTDPTIPKFLTNNIKKEKGKEIVNLIDKMIFDIEEDLVTFNRAKNFLYKYSNTQLLVGFFTGYIPLLLVGYSYISYTIENREKSKIEQLELINAKHNIEIKELKDSITKKNIKMMSMKDSINKHPILKRGAIKPVANKVHKQ